MDRVRVVELHYITEIANLDSITRLGILCHRRAEKVPHLSIADEEVQDRRRDKRVPNGRLLHDYANVYFDARNAMLYKRLGRKRHLAVVRVSPQVLDLPNVVITDGNAASGATSFFGSPAGLAHLDEDTVYAESWTDPDTWTYWEKKRQRCAEVLVPDLILPEFVVGSYVCADDVLPRCVEAVPSLDVTVNTRVFFG